MIYFRQDTQTQAIKIGCAANPSQRMSVLRSSTPNPLVLLGTIEGIPDQERVYHDRFAQHHLQGEWFKGEILPDVMEIITNNPCE